MINRPLFVLMGSLIFALGAAAQPETWQLDPAHSAAQFAVRHMGISTVRGAFSKLSGNASYDPNDPSKTSIDVTIDAASVDSRVERRDDDLRSDHFLDVKKYPTITFRSKHTETAGPDKLKTVGDLTIHGVTKEITLDIAGPSKAVKDPRGKMHMGASATTTIDRTAFGITGYQGMIGNDLAITIDVELVRPETATTSTR